MESLVYRDVVRGVLPGSVLGRISHDFTNSIDYECTIKGLKIVTVKEFFTSGRPGNLEDKANRNRINCFGSNCALTVNRGCYRLMGLIYWRKESLCVLAEQRMLI